WALAAQGSVELLRIEWLTIGFEARRTPARFFVWEYWSLFLSQAPNLDANAVVAAERLDADREIQIRRAGGLDAFEHRGSCADRDFSVLYPLANVVGGLVGRDRARRDHEIVEAVGDAHP